MELGVGGQSHKTRTLIPDTGAHIPGMTLPRRAGSGLTASAAILDVAAPACTNGVWPPLRPVSVAQKNKPSTMSSSSVQSIDLPMDCTARFWAMRRPNGCSTPAPRSSVAKQWIKEELAQTKEEFSKIFEPKLVIATTKCELLELAILLIALPRCLLLNYATPTIRVNFVSLTIDASSRKEKGRRRSRTMAPDLSKWGQRGRRCIFVEIL